MSTPYSQIILSIPFSFPSFIRHFWQWINRYPTPTPYLPHPTQLTPFASKLYIPASHTGGLYGFSIMYVSTARHSRSTCSRPATAAVSISTRYFLMRLRITTRSNTDDSISSSKCSRSEEHTSELQSRFDL